MLLNSSLQKGAYADVEMVVAVDVLSASQLAGSIGVVGLA